MGNSAQGTVARCYCFFCGRISPHGDRELTAYELYSAEVLDLDLCWLSGVQTIKSRLGWSGLRGKTLRHRFVDILARTVAGGGVSSGALGVNGYSTY